MIRFRPAVIVAALALAASLPSSALAGSGKHVWWLPAAWGEPIAHAKLGHEYIAPPATFVIPAHEGSETADYAFRSLRYQGWGTPHATAVGQARWCAGEGSCTAWKPVRIELTKIVHYMCSSGQFYTRYRAVGLFKDNGQTHEALSNC